MVESSRFVIDSLFSVYLETAMAQKFRPLHFGTLILAVCLSASWGMANAGNPPLQAPAEVAFPVSAKRILFLGDSITHAGHYVAWIETQLRLQGVEPLPEIINLGLGSETLSGLSEPDHPFPRPDVHERLDRALAKIKPDVVVACYGMNDGIYYPFGEERFQAYQAGVNRLIKKVHAAGAKLVLMTPPPFDPLPLRGKGKLKPAGEDKYAYFAMYENYDDVLARYGKWILKQMPRVEMVIDLHTPLAEFTAQKRKSNPKFTCTPDGIHPNLEGHRLLGKHDPSSLGYRIQRGTKSRIIKTGDQTHGSPPRCLAHGSRPSAAGREKRLALGGGIEESPGVRFRNPSARGKGHRRPSVPQ